MFAKDKVVKVLQVAYDNLCICLEDIDKIEEMLGGVPESQKLVRMRAEAMDKCTERIAIIMSITASLSDEVIKFTPEYFEVFKRAEYILFGKNYKYTKKVEKQ